MRGREDPKAEDASAIEQTVTWEVVYKDAGQRPAHAALLLPLLIHTLSLLPHRPLSSSFLRVQHDFCSHVRLLVLALVNYLVFKTDNGYAFQPPCPAPPCLCHHYPQCSLRLDFGGHHHHNVD